MNKMIGIVVFVVVMVVVIIFLVSMKKSQQGKVVQSKKDFLATANRMSEEAVPEVKGYETLAVQLAKKIDRKEELMKTGKYAAKKLFVRVVSGNTLDYRETQSIINTNDVYVVRYRDEKMYFFNIGQKWTCNQMEMQGQDVLYFSPENLESIKVKAGDFTICGLDGEEFTFDFSKGVRENRLEFSKEYKAFKEHLKSISSTL